MKYHMAHAHNPIVDHCPHHVQYFLYNICPLWIFFPPRGLNALRSRFHVTQLITLGQVVACPILICFHGMGLKVSEGSAPALPSPVMEFAAAAQSVGRSAAATGVSLRGFLTGLVKSGGAAGDVCLVIHLD